MKTESTKDKIKQDEQSNNVENGESALKTESTQDTNYGGEQKSKSGSLENDVKLAKESAAAFFSKKK